MPSLKTSLSHRERFICLLDNTPAGNADVIICLEGGGLSRAGHAAKLWKEGRAKTIWVTGGLDKPPFSIPARQLEYFLIGAGVTPTAIRCEHESTNTRLQALAMMLRAVVERWKSAILVASDYHQYRAFLTFLKAMQEADYKFRLTSASVRNIWAPDILAEEFNKIEAYQAKGHCASYNDGLEHLCA